MNWISRLERKYGRFCIPNLISLIVGGQILVYAIELFVNQFVSSYLGLSRGLLLMGQVWRLITRCSIFCGKLSGKSGKHCGKTGFFFTKSVENPVEKVKR